MVLWMLFFSTLFMYFKFFSKKILVLLSLEICLISIICLNYLFSFNSVGVSSFFSSMCFLTFMVVDSVFGLCLLIFSSRNSTSFSNFVFNY